MKVLFLFHNGLCSQIGENKCCQYLLEKLPKIYSLYHSITQFVYIQDWYQNKGQNKRLCTRNIKMQISRLRKTFLYIFCNKHLRCFMAYTYKAPIDIINMYCILFQSSSSVSFYIALVYKTSKTCIYVSFLELCILALLASCMPILKQQIKILRRRSTER